MSEADRISIANKACLGGGVNTITSFNDGSAEATFLREWYEITVESELSLYKWRFATKTVNLKSSLLNITPDTVYNTAYQAPNDVLSVDTVLVGESPINYDRYQDQIHTKDTSADEVIIKYRYRADETLWNPYFRMLIIYRLATMLAFSIARKSDVAESMEKLAEVHWRRSKTEDAQAQTNQKVRLNKLSLARGGTVRRFWRDR